MLLGLALDAPAEEWDKMVALNVQGLLHVTHAALPHLVNAAKGSPRRVADLVNISSTAGRVARPGGSVYALTKFGLAGFAESLRQELQPGGWAEGGGGCPCPAGSFLQIHQATSKGGKRVLARTPLHVRCNVL